jgi:hypothetical protein
MPLSAALARAPSLACRLDAPTCRSLPRPLTKYQAFPEAEQAEAHSRIGEPDEPFRRPPIYPDDCGLARLVVPLLVLTPPIVFVGHTRSASGHIRQQPCMPHADQSQQPRRRGGSASGTGAQPRSLVIHHSAHVNNVFTACAAS